MTYGEQQKAKALDEYLIAPPSRPESSYHRAAGVQTAARLEELERKWALRKRLKTRNGGRGERPGDRGVGGALVGKNGPTAVMTMHGVRGGKASLLPTLVRPVIDAHQPASRKKKTPVVTGPAANYCMRQRQRLMKKLQQHQRELDAQLERKQHAADLRRKHIWKSQLRAKKKRQHDRALRLLEARRKN